MGKAKLVIVISIALVLYISLTSMSVILSPQSSRPNSSRSAANSVILRAAPGNTMVQMFDTLSDSPDVNVTTFPDGWGCTKLGGLTHYGGISFYKLDCGNKTGYVNAKWVD